MELFSFTPNAVPKWAQKIPEPKPGVIDNITCGVYTECKESAAGNGQPLVIFFEVIAELWKGAGGHFFFA